MINFNIPPSPDLACGYPRYALRSYAFNDEENLKIRSIGDFSIKVNQISQCGTCNPNFTITQLQVNNDTHFVYERLGGIIRDLNGQFFQYDLYGFVEEIRYIVYTPNIDPSVNAYSWHIDTVSNKADMPRKLSFLVQLSDANEYEGGNLEINVSEYPTILNKTKNLLYTFPSSTLNRVAPVSSGELRLLLGWVTGPKFK